MSIRSADLRRRVLRVSPDTLVGYALKAIQAWPRPEEWLLLCPLAGGYAAIGVQELARRAAVDDRLLARRLDDLGLAASPSVDVEEELDAARGLLGATGYVVALFSESFSIERERGALLVPAEGRAAVKAAASLPGGLDPDAPLARERLLFRVRAPDWDGLAALSLIIFQLTTARATLAFAGASALGALLSLVWARSLAARYRAGG